MGTGINTGKLSLSDRFSENQPALSGFELFQSNFSLVKAYHLTAQNVVVKAPALEEEAYKVRYNAYCQEHQYEQGMACGIERDAYDDFSTMALVQHVPSQTYVGTVRLIPYSNTDISVPLLRSCAQELPIDRMPACQYVEISRLCVSYARMDAANLTGQEASLVLPSVLAASLAMSHDIHATHWLGAMRPSLVRKLDRGYGIALDWLGENMDYHGVRVPFVSAVHTIETSVKSKRSVLGQIVSSQINGDHQDAFYMEAGTRPSSP